MSDQSTAAEIDTADGSIDLGCAWDHPRAEPVEPAPLSHTVTIWSDQGNNGATRHHFTAPHIRSQPLPGGWLQVELLDHDSQVIGVEQFRTAHRVSIRPVP